ncbi:SURF1 family cytochrome oxidase biogenesis protein [Pseudolysinimonas kribbensis]|uniref:SURF1 family cytochrome oxidase biogenesis protein n=1 Tax=Pseudolysinimonas kribbensis TaxID=433641 RepID=UPI0024E0C84D|nr:SURF1 family cytochrome oxidase biogenesis protein [Pseudolysinimonas kribbensis]
MSGIRRWGGYVALVVVFSIACGVLSWWQWSRNAERTAENTLISINWSKPAVPVDQALPSLDSWRHDLEWREVTLHGRYLPGQQLLVRDRARNDNPGFEVLVPLRLPDGRIFVVDRGWLPIPARGDVPQVPAPPSGDVSVVVRLQQSEPDLPGRTSPRGQIASIDLPQIARATGADTYTGAYGTMTREDPPRRAGPSRSPSRWPIRGRSSPTRSSGSCSRCSPSWAWSGPTAARSASAPCRPRSARSPCGRAAPRTTPTTRTRSSTATRTSWRAN